MDVIKLLQARKKDWKDQRVLDYFAEQETLEGAESCIYMWLDRILPQATDQSTNWQVRRACDYIKEYYRKDREMGMNIPAYVNQVRLERAKELLRHSPQKIYEIALDVGYLSTTAFHVAFKKQTGLTPAEYRNQMGESSVQI